jgi:hypothetical protein
MNAVDKRFAALRALNDTYQPASNGYHLIESATQDDVIADILALKVLGRTDRWRNCLDNWVTMVKDNPDSLEWAVLQGSIYAGYAAE